MLFPRDFAVFIGELDNAEAIAVAASEITGQQADSGAPILVGGGVLGIYAIIFRKNGGLKGGLVGVGRALQTVDRVEVDFASGINAQRRDGRKISGWMCRGCLLYTSDAADE